MIAAKTKKTAGGKPCPPTGKDVALSLEHVVANAALGPISGAAVLGFVALFYAVVVYGSLKVDLSDTELAHGSVHV